MQQPNYLKIKLLGDIKRLARNYSHMRYDSKYVQSLATRFELGNSSGSEISEIKMVAEDISTRANECIILLKKMEKKIVIFTKFIKRFIKGN